MSGYIFSLGTLLLSAGLTAQAAAPAHTTLPPSAGYGQSTVLDKHRHQSLSSKERPPLSSSREHLKLRPDESPAKRRVDKSKPNTGAASCDVSTFTNNTGWALVSAIRSSTTDCINTLYSLTGDDARRAFNESQMTYVAYGLRDDGNVYAGDNRNSTEQIVTYLRAGYYVQYYNAADVGSYGSGLKNAIESGLDAFFNNPASRIVSDANGNILMEAVTLIDSSTENARYLGTVQELLDTYDNSWDAYWGMLNAANNTFTVLFRGHQNADFQALVQTDPSITDTLSNFSSRHWGKLGGTESYLVVNASRELARFLQYAGLKSKVRPLVKSIVDRSSVTGVTAPVWVSMGDSTDYYDAGNCTYYNLCGWKTKADAAALPLKKICSSTLTLRAQSMTADEMQRVCTSVLSEESYFHTKFLTNRVPVANDNNTNLELVVFDSSSDYETYAGPLYGIDTNNGGMYLEGDPSKAGNQARFIAYEAEWVRPTFEVWNLNHEYDHYLDGRFNMYGDFNAAISTPTVWWIEGSAEHMSYCFRQVRYDNALAQASLQTYTLNELFDTDYNDDQTRIYNWGYLAVSFMMERHRADITTLLGDYRPGDWNGARTLLKSTIGSRYDAEFRSWLANVASVGVNCDGGTSPNQAPTAAFDTGVNGLTATFTDRSTDVDGSIASRKWTFHDGTTSTSPNPSKTYAAAGKYSVQLKVTDNGGLTSKVKKTITVSSGGSNTCPQRTDEMANGCVRKDLSGAANDVAYFYIYVDKPNAQLAIRTSAGTGNADLYVSTSGWATPTQYDYRSIGGTNAESITVPVTTAGYVYLSVHGKAAYSGLSLSTNY